MNNDKNMDVVDWRDTPPAIVFRSRAPRQLWSPTVIGIVGTILLHSLLVPSVLLGSQASKAHPPYMLEPGELVKDGAAESLVLITLPTLASSAQPSIQAVSLLPALTKLKNVSPANPDPPRLLNLEVLTLGEDQLAGPTVNSGDGAEQARLFGIYTGQIQARIERIWRRPRTPLNEGDGQEVPTNPDETFQCEAQIVQDATGNVQEILLPRCNGSAAWRRSLVTAIQQASPLPAPPSTRVFTRSVVLSFVGLPYGLGSQDEEYEIEPERVAQSAEYRAVNTRGHTDTRVKSD